MRSPKKFLKAERGVALIEFALVFPFLFVLLFGCVEVIRLMYIHQKQEKAGYVIADVMTRYLPATNPVGAKQLTEAEVNTNIFPIFGRIMGEPLQGGFKDATRQAIILTSVTKTATNMVINWQITSPNPASTDNTLTTCDSVGNCPKSIVNGAVPGPTSVAVKGTAATFTNDPTSDAAGQLAANPMNTGENMIVSEVFFMYTPLLQNLLQGMSSVSRINFFLQPHLYVKRTFFIPRNGSQLYLPPTFPAP